MKMSSCAMQLGGGRNFFSPQWTSKCFQGLFACLCSTEHGPSLGVLWAILARCLQLLLHKGAGRKLCGLPGQGPRVSPGGCLFSSVALSTAPCQGFSEPFWLHSCLLLLHLQGATHALAHSGCLAHWKLGAGAISALPLAQFPVRFLLVQIACA